MPADGARDTFNQAVSAAPGDSAHDTLQYIRQYMHSHGHSVKLIHVMKMCKDVQVQHYGTKVFTASKPGAMYVTVILGHGGQSCAIQ